ncbi:D-serine ammonia-lyase [Dyella sp. 333MFSha]|uniref:D-serine ammonia-lyase n=1 Tax=Dyella sp. 333MFSha TaxID=1798240 RepID=UPI000891B8C0|nr:D-serine ammonia-lyase [Dyella sp. 333MFSha]SDF40684.1 D-serine ammonia-lyase [Dyella sp. 333MFSha]
MTGQWIHDGNEAAHSLSARKPTFFRNVFRDGVVLPAQRAAIAGAEARMERFAPVAAKKFFALQGTDGRIRSPLFNADALAAPSGFSGHPSSLFVKADHVLPVAGSIKARGGAHAVVEIAECAAGGPLTVGSSAHEARVHAQEISVGSTGNLGLSIGTFATALGFRATVHMSSQAKAWKKDRLRAQGVTVVEHEGDYLDALAEARRSALKRPHHHFIDDESSEALLYGYAAGARELAGQLTRAGRTVDADRPLFVHVPCGVGGAPAGIALGLHAIYGPDVHCFYAEPTEAPSVLLALATGEATRSVYELGLTGVTQADGLAVPRASPLAVGLSRHVAAGVHTVTDAQLLRALRCAHDAMNLRLEPSAAAGFAGAQALSGRLGEDYLSSIGSSARLDAVTHVVWTTGGALVPDDEFERYLQHPSIHS